MSSNSSWPPGGRHRYLRLLRRGRNRGRHAAWPARRLQEIASRVEQLAGLADELMNQRAAARVGETHDVLIEEIAADDGDGSPRRYGGRAAHQAPEVDGATEVIAHRPLAIGDLVRVRVSGSQGVDLVANLID